MEFYNPAQRIKKLRKQLNMKQQEFQDVNMTRSFYSMLENNKRNLSFDTAAKILEKFNKRSKELGISLGIDEKYILMSPAEEAEKYCLDNLEDFINEKKCMDLIDISRTYKLEEVEATIHKALGDKRYINKSYHEAFLNYSISVDLYKNTINNKNIAYLYNRLGMCKFCLIEYRDAAMYFNRALYYSGIYKDKLISKYSIYNIAKCYKKQEKYNEAIQYIDCFMSNINKNESVEDYIHAQSLKASCLDSIGNVDAAILICIELLEENFEIKDSLKAFIYNNLGAFYLKKEDLLVSLEYFNKSQAIRSETDKINLAHTLIDKSEVYIKQKLYKEAIMLINLGIDMANINNDSEYLLKSYYFLVDIYTLTKDYYKIEEVYNNMINILKDKDDHNNLLKVYMKLCELSFKNNDLKKIHKYFKLSQIILESCY